MLKPLGRLSVKMVAPFQWKSPHALSHEGCVVRQAIWNEPIRLPMSFKALLKTLFCSSLSV